jgi:hypothetical protein
LAAPVEARDIKSDAPCYTWAHTPLLPSPPPLLPPLRAAAGCRFFGFSFERLCSPGENKKKIQEEAGAKLKRARGQDKNENKKKAAAKPGEKYSACVYLGGFTPKSLLLLSLSEHDSSASGSESPSEAACAAGAWL